MHESLSSIKLGSTYDMSGNNNVYAIFTGHRQASANTRRILSGIQRSSPTSISGSQWSPDAIYKEWVSLHGGSTACRVSESSESHSSDNLSMVLMDTGSGLWIRTSQRKWSSTGNRFSSTPFDHHPKAHTRAPAIASTIKWLAVATIATKIMNG